MEFLATLDHLIEMIAHVRRQAKRFKVQDKLIYKMELVCEEALVNIISYAYPKAEGTVTIDCEKKPCSFEIILRDRGVAFNPLNVVINPQTDTPISIRRVGGLGIFLMRRSADEISYQRLGEENVLHFTFIVVSNEN